MNSRGQKFSPDRIRAVVQIPMSCWSCHSFRRRANVLREVTFNHCHRLDCFLLAASLGLFGGCPLVVGTNEKDAILQGLLQQIGAIAIGARLSHWLECRGELALRVVGAAVKEISTAGLLFGDVAILTHRALHSNEVLLDVLAFWIAAARYELAEAAVPDQQIASALRTLFVERNVGHLLPLIETPRCLAVRISRTSHELPKAPALEHHRTATVLAVFLLRRLLKVCGIEVREVDGILFGKRATVGIGFVIGAAGIERAVLAPLDHQR